MPRDDKRFLRRFGAQVAEARRKAGLTQEAAASAAAIDYKRWQRIELGQANVTMRTLLRLGGALGVDPAELLRGCWRPQPSVRSPRR